MAIRTGSEGFTYRPAEGWGVLPEGWRLGEVAAVAVDRLDRVYVFHRGEHPLIVFDRDGNFLRSWGEGTFVRPHGLDIAPDGSVFCTDEGGDSVRRYTPEGRLLMTIQGRRSPYQSGLPFHRCTHTALAPNGDIYVSDGYGNSRVHRYSPDGRVLLGSWGEPGTGPGQFNLPHQLVCDASGWVYVADRENHRIQVFAADGRYETQWNNLHRPSGLCLSPGPEPVFYVGELGAYLASNLRWPNVGPRISVLSTAGALIGRLDSRIYEHPGAGAFVSPHGIAVDSAGDLYIGDVCYSAWPSLFPDREMPGDLRVLHKFRRTPGGPTAGEQRPGSMEGWSHE